MMPFSTVSLATRTIPSCSTIRPSNGLLCPLVRTRGTERGERSCEMVVEQKVLHAQAVLDELKRCGVSHVIWLPDHDSQHMFQTLQQNPDLTLVQVCREGEAMPLALGLVLGGKTPAVLIQNTGFFESGDSIRRICIDLKLPLVTLIAWRGYEGDGQP